ncbi:MAG: hypothetical protein M3083_15960 [Actinomycetota bacterium]|nr:hypothetical protein [Actinomycetota bacterium]
MPEPADGPYAPPVRGGPVPVAPSAADAGSGAGAGQPSGSRTRLVVGTVCGAALAALGGLILGEYPFTGVMPYIAGVLFALVVAEVMMSVSHQSGWGTAMAATVCTVGGLGWAVWISVGEGKVPIPIGGWVAVAIGAVVALVSGGLRAGGRPRPSSRPSS